MFNVPEALIVKSFVTIREEELPPWFRVPVLIVSEPTVVALFGSVGWLVAVTITTLSVEAGGALPPLLVVQFAAVDHVVLTLPFQVLV